MIRDGALPQKGFLKQEEIIVKAAIEGRLPRGFGLTRFIPPMAWSDQWAALGLASPSPN
jgi:hypothetical protein